MAASIDHDGSNGWEAVADAFIAQARRSTIGVRTLRDWAAHLPAGAAVLDLGCGPGGPRSATLSDRGLSVYALDASPTLAAAYQTRFPDAHVACEPIEDSLLFRRSFDGALAWGLLFLLSPIDQRRLIQRVAATLERGGRFLFTAPANPCEWADFSTGRLSVSLGLPAYEAELSRAGLQLLGTAVDEGENHYYDAVRT